MIERFANKNIPLRIRTEVQEHPVFRFNMVALRVGQVAACILAVALLAVDNPNYFTLPFLVLGLAVLFYMWERFVFPRLRSTWTLDLSVAGHQACIYAVICYAVSVTEKVQSSAATACIITISGVLFIRNRVFVVVAAGGIAGWMLTRYLNGHSLDKMEIVNLVVTAPATAIVARIAVLTSTNAIYQAKKQEQKTVLDLEKALVRLQSETNRRKESEDQLLQAQKYESLGILAAGIAHDFNNLLLAISVFAENIQATATNQANVHQADQIVSAVRQATGICGQMLTYTGRTVYERGRVNLQELVVEAMPLLRAAVRSSITIESNCSDRPCILSATEVQLQQVLMNLIVNASEAIESDGRIEIGVVPVSITKDDADESEGVIGEPIVVGDYVKLTVTDNGQGMTDTVVRQIFDPYFTTKETGHGFGLSTVLGVVRSHQATMFVDSNPSVGTTVTLLFPTVAAADIDSSQETPPRTALPGDSNRVLIVDDEEMIRVPLARMLTLLGWVTVEASNGNEALSVLREDPDFAVMILDFRMPEMNGHQILLAARDLGVSAPAVLCSGFISEPEQNAIIADFDAFLPKPFRRQDLDTLLGQLVDV